MLSRQSWSRAAAALVVSGVVVTGATGPAVAGPDDRGTPPPAAAPAGAVPPGAPAPAGAQPGSADGDGHGDEHRAQAPGRDGDDRGRRSRPGRAEPAAPPAEGRGDGSDADRPGAGGSEPPRHTPVTVCHRLGNGSYHLLTFDDNALKAHQSHGDLYPVPAEGCPAEVDPTTPPAVITGTGSAGSAGVVVAGVEQLTTGGKPAAASVLGVQENTAVASPAGVLPQTGAGRIGVLLAGALALLATGAVLLRRRGRGLTV